MSSYKSVTNKGILQQYKILYNDIKNVNSFKNLYEISVKHRVKLLVFIVLCIIIIQIIRLRTRKEVGKLGESFTMNFLNTIDEQSKENGLILKIIKNLENANSDKKLGELGKTLSDVLDRIRLILSSDFFKNDPNDTRTAEKKQEDINNRLMYINSILDKLVYKNNGLTLLEQFKEIQKSLPSYLGGDVEVDMVGNRMFLPISNSVRFVKRTNNFGKNSKNKNKKKRSRKFSRKQYN